MYDHFGLIGSVIIFTLFYYFTTKKYNYWQRKNVPYPKPIPVFGNYFKYILLQKSSAEISRELCQQFLNEPYFGSYFGTEPALVILQPDIIKLVFSKDFYYFSSRELMDYRYKEIVTQNIFFQCGDVWKVIRSNLTPLFSSAKLKKMFHLLEKCAHTLEDLLEYETNASKIIEARELMNRYTIDCICSCGFGIDTRTMDRNAKKNPFTKMGKIIFDHSYLGKVFRIMRQMWPQLFYGVGLRSFPKSISYFFKNLITGVFKSRNYMPTQRNDFVDNLLTIFMMNKTIVADGLSKNGQSKKVELKMDDDLMVAQCVAFFGAGFETSASTSSLTLYELAKNQKAQKRVQEEIDAYLKKNNNKLSDDCVSELPFLEACLLETLRLYPVLPIITREVVENYTFPSGLQLEKGIRVHLPVYHLHRNPELFPDPEEYKPERFMPHAVHDIKPYTFFPFGEGPRTCIGMRFSKLLVLPGLITFLKTYTVSLEEGAPHKLKLEPTTLLLKPASSLSIKVTKRPDWETRVYAK